MLQLGRRCCNATSSGVKAEVMVALKHQLERLDSDFHELFLSVDMRELSGNLFVSEANLTQGSEVQAVSEAYLHGARMGAGGSSPVVHAATDAARCGPLRGNVEALGDLAGSGIADANGNALSLVKQALVASHAVE